MTGPTGPSGVLGPFTVDSPYWPDVEPVVAAAREQAGVDLTVLRLLVTPDLSAHAGSQGGCVSYLAQVTQPIPAQSRLLAPTSAELGAAAREHPLRLPWAQPDGIASIVAWADDALRAAGTPRTGPVQQVKTWNLSSVLRLPTASGMVWCKSVPPFFAHEGAIITAVAVNHPDLVPRLLGVDVRTGSVLMAHLPGEDQWHCPPHRMHEMVQVFVDLQNEWSGRMSDLLALGLPDWRAPALLDQLTTLIGRPDVWDDLGDDDRRGLDAQLGQLPSTLTALTECGIPQTLVHGDLHTGNWRYGDGRLTLLDWGDSGVGHPMLDLPAFLGRAPEADRPRLRAAWAQRWSAHHPQAETERAMKLIEPVAALHQALIYRTFLDQIEPDERIYHRNDVPRWLRRAVQSA